MLHVGKFVFIIIYLYYELYGTVIRSTVYDI